MNNIVPLDKVNLNIERRIRDNYAALKSALFVEKCVGIFRINMKNGQLHTPHWIMKTYSAFLAISYTTLFAMFLRVPAVIKDEESLISVIDDVPSFFHLFNYIASMISTTFFLSKSNIKIFYEISELDDQLLKSNDSSFHKDCWKTNIKVMALIIISHGIFFIIELTVKISQNEYDVFFLVVFPVYFVQKFEMIVFCLFILTMRNRLVLINGYLANFLQEKTIETVFTVSNTTVDLDKTKNWIGSPSESNTKIRDLAMMFNKLGTICAMINDTYNFQIFMSLVSTFVYIVIAIWTSLYIFRYDNTSGPLVTIFIWCFSAIMFVTATCFICERLVFVRNSTKILVNQIIMDYDLPKTMRVQAKAFMELIDAWPLRISIYDMFCVDVTLMLKFISVSTTYLIIIIQISHYT